MVKGDSSLIYIFGGYLEGWCINELWIYDTEKLTWENVQPMGKAVPPPRANHASVLWHNASRNEDILVVTGGVNQTLERLNDVWLYHVNSQTWEEVKIPAGSVWLSERSEHTAIVDRNKLVIFGGRGSTMKELNDVMVFDLVSLKWQVKSSLCLKPSPDKSFTMGTTKTSPENGKTLAINNRPADSSFSGVSFDVGKSGESPTGRNTSPKNRASMSPSSYKKKKPPPPKVAEIESALEEMKILTPTTSSMLHSVVMYAGEKAVEPYGQTISKRRKRISMLLTAVKPEDDEHVARGRIPCARSGHSANVVDKYMVIFGGDRAQVALNDIYLLDLTGN